MRVVFFGSPEFALPALDAVTASSHAILRVISQPDRPRGRGRQLQPTPVKARALELGHEVETPETINRRAFIDAVLALEPDALVVVAYGLKMPRRLLHTPPHGSLNIHPSLLPRYRGAAPVEWAILNGDTRTGVTLMYQSEGWDEGDIILQEKTPIHPGETAGELSHRLAQAGARLLVHGLDLLDAGRAPRTPQPEHGITFAPKITPELERLDWTAEGAVLVHRILGLSPEPGAHTAFRGERLRVLRARLLPALSGPPGEVIEIRKREGPVVAAGTDAVLLLEVQPQGKRVMSGRDFCNGHRIAPGERFGDPGADASTHNT